MMIGTMIMETTWRFSISVVCCLVFPVETCCCLTIKHLRVTKLLNTLTCFPNVLFWWIVHHPWKTERMKRTKGRWFGSDNRQGTRIRWQQRHHRGIVGQHSVDTSNEQQRHHPYRVCLAKQSKAKQNKRSIKKKSQRFMSILMQTNQGFKQTKITEWVYVVCGISFFLFLCSFSTDSPGQLHVLWFDGDTVGMDGTEVGVLKQRHKVRFRRFLKSRDGHALETQIVFEILGNFAHQTLKG